MYMFLGLAIICDDYFEPVLECLCEDLNLPQDVAGATFMVTDCLNVKISKKKKLISPQQAQKEMQY